MPENTDLARARLLIDANRPVEALSLLSKVLAMEPDDVDALRLFAATHLRDGDSSEALRAAYRLLAVNPDDVSALQLAAKAHSAIDDHDEAIVAADLALERAPQNPDAHITRVVVGLAAGDTGPRVSKSATMAVTLAPFSPSTHITLGNFLWRDGRPDEARAAYGEALRIDPQSIVARTNLASLDLGRRRAVP
ncbi:Beta-barrel assembly-enhancing protease [Frondihabitans sp. 762G35]|uniref:tetratricopeptide repeat protein n=1 Tax=Frondihabitans sp. 762G35 TaxID=1446794 RepID=UPI000D2059C7|nr:tetratricopeptide repeat protein [Frondihabitans sp. 762G35]ARC55525.1 Beta-barrel assembly-enhancing protease [Frondihabitans sp. 762G35]